MKKLWHRIGSGILEALYPTRAGCLGCGDDRGCSEPFLCDACSRLLVPANVTARREEWSQRGIELVGFAYYYGRPVKGLIGALKFRGVRMLADDMARSLMRLMESRSLGPYDMIIPVPLHPSRQSDRGYNQAEVLAKALSSLCGIPLCSTALKRTRRTRQQAKLSHRKRRRNLEGAFCAGSEVQGKRILLLDDVITTGSTVCACAEALRKAGAVGVQAISVAGTHYCHRGRAKIYRKSSAPER